jgi:hypothetical protein
VSRRRLVDADRVEIVWVLRYWLACWRGRRSAPLVRERRVLETYSFNGAHALHEPSSP